jgi:hypothetical protein
MRMRLTIITVLTAVVAAISATPAAAAAERSCGTVRAGRNAARVTILHGPVSCTQARAASKNYIAGHSTFHGPVNGPRSGQYITVPGDWRCSVIEGGAAVCTRGGSRVNPREMIGFSVLS